MNKKQHIQFKETNINKSLLHLLDEFKKVKKEKIKITKDNFDIPENLTKDGYAADDAYNGYCDGIYDNIGFEDSLIGNNSFKGYQQLSYYRQHPIVNRIINTPAVEMTRRWIKLISTGNEDKSEVIKKLEFALNKKFNIKEIIKKTIENTILYGGSLLYVKLKNDDQHLSKELIINKSSIGINSVEYFNIIEPIVCTLQPGWNATDPLLNTFYNPQSYMIYTKEVHISRLIKFTYIEAPYLLKPLYRFFGISLVQLCLRDIERLENMKNSQEDIIARLNLTTLKADLNSIIYGNSNGNDLFARLKLFNDIKDNNGVLILNGETESAEQLTLNISEVTDNIRQAVEFICMAIQTPATKFMGMSMGGFNSTGESEIRNYYDNVASNQESMLRVNITKIIHIIMLNEIGYIDEKIDFEFNSLWETNQLEESQIRVNETNRAVANVGAGITTVMQEQERLNNDPGSLYDHLEISDNDNLDNEDDIDEQDQVLYNDNTEPENVDKIPAL